MSIKHWCNQLFALASNPQQFADSGGAIIESNSANTMGVISALCILFSLVILAVLIVIAGVFFRHSSRSIAKILCTSGTALLISAALSGYHAANFSPNYRDYVFNESLVIDAISLKIFAIFLVIWGISTTVASTWMKRSEGQSVPFEVPGLLIFAAFGYSLLIFANDIMTAYLAMEVAALVMYPPLACHSDRGISRSSSLEGVIKYFIFNGVMSAMYLFGAALIYSQTKSLILGTSLLSLSNLDGSGSILFFFGAILMLMAVCGKLGLAPFHFWMLDLYQSAPTYIMTLLSSGSKIALTALIIKFSFIYREAGLKLTEMIWFLAILSLIIGSLGGLMQKNIRRLLAYSAINNLAFILLATLAPRGEAAAYQYAIAYTIGMAMPSFIVLLALQIYTVAEKERSNEITAQNICSDNYNNISVERSMSLSLQQFSDAGGYQNISQFSGLHRIQPFLAASFTIFLFSMAGIPPFAGFFVKFDILRSLIEGKMYGTAASCLLAAVLSAFYYLRIISAMYFSFSNENGDKNREQVNENGIKAGKSYFVVRYGFITAALFVAVLFNILYVLWW